ncbi:MAG: OmpA family protein [Bacteroidales bacterium]|nr:OmpA family protein [Bacteroidales bacterium]
MKRLAILLVTLLTAFTATAQIMDWVSMPKHVWGVHVGGRANDMSLSYSGYSKYSHTPVIGPSMGLYARHRLVNGVSLRTDLLYAARGMDLTWCDVNYSINVPYLDFRPLLQLNLCQPWWEIVPYINIGLELNYTLPNGNIKYKSNSVPSTTIDLNQNNIKPFDVGVWAGMGLDYHFKLFYSDFLLAFEAGADLGLLNNFSKAEQSDNPHVVNSDMVNASNLGTRKNRGIEVSVTLGIPIYKKLKISKNEDSEDSDLWPSEPSSVEVPEVIVQTTVKPAPDSVKTPTPRKRIIEYEYKECYSLEEVLAMIERGEEVCDLRICMYDINFAFDSYELTMGSKRKLEPVVQILRMHPEYNLHVNGHTDSIGSYEYNDRLSNYRASEVMGFMIRKGINSSRLSSKGFGERYPIESNSTEIGRYHNRRVELELYCTKPEEKDE